MVVHPRPTFVRGMRRQPTKLTGLKVIHSASLWQGCEKRVPDELLAAPYGKSVRRQMWV